MKPMSFAVAMLLFVMPTLAQNGPNDPADAMAQILQSHIDANVPDASVFDAYLKRDLTAYFCKGADGCTVQYELLRREPTQSGIAWPKFYAWVRVTAGSGLKMEGAVRLAAMEKLRFEVWDFLSVEDIAASPERVASVFPRLLVEGIVQRAQHH